METLMEQSLEHYKSMNLTNIQIVNRRMRQKIDRANSRKQVSS